MNIIPGEPIPPGFEDEVNRQPQIQASVDQYKGNALIGIEYTIELHEDDHHEPVYLCTLCDKRGDPRTIINHWCSFNHRMKYLEKHYPSAVRECQPVKYKPNSHNIMILLVQSLAEAIEDHYGRLLVSVMNADDFRKRKSTVTEQIMKKNHFDEKSGPNFLNAIIRTLREHVPYKKKDPNVVIKAPKRLNSNAGNGKASVGTKDGLDEISSDSDNQDSVKKQKIQTRVQEPAFTQKLLVSSASTEEPGKKLPTPKELSLQASHIAQERYKWEKYRCMLEIQLKQMEKIQADYEKTPEKHPHYPEEWKKFWNRRYKELQAEKKVDPNKYDYKPEWIVFWTKRMKELFNAEVEKKKKEIKVKLGLPENAEEKVDQLKEKYKLPVNRLTSANKSNSRGGQALDVINISDDDSPRPGRYTRQRRSRTRSRSRSHSRSPRGIRHRGYRRSHSRSRSRSRSLSPFSDEYELPSSSKHHLHKKPHNPIRPYGVEHPPSDYYPYARVQRYPPPNALPNHYQPAPHHYRVLDASKIPKYQELDSRISKECKEEPKEEEPEGPLTVVAVLRLLTALEEHLGSLGPKVVDMLGKALALEKVKGNSSDDLLMNEDHCVFFETTKEKLKGLLIADVLDDQQKVKAVKRAIKNIAAIIHQVTTKASSTEANKDNNEARNTDGTSKSKKTQKMSSAGPNIKDLPFDRQTVATKLAAALVMEGREDVSTADMDKLIYMFILMVKLSKPKREDDGNPLYCKDILPQLGIARKLPTSSLSLANLPAIVDDLLENEVNALVQEVEEEMENEAAGNEKEAKTDNNSSMLESLTDSDLQTLLQNFKHLSSEEQHHLIAHLKKLESADPSRVEKLRKFVNISDLTGSKESSNKSAKTSDSTPTKSSSSSRSKTRLDDTPPSGSRKVHNALPPGTEDDDDDDDGRRRVNPNKFSLDDDEDDDYNFDDVFKAASSNVNRLSEEHSRQSDKNTKSPIVPVSSSPSALTFNPAGLKTSSLNDTQNLIANLMGSLQQSNSNSANKASSSSSSSAAAKHTTPQPTTPQPVPPAVAAPQHEQLPPQPHANQMALYQQQQQQHPQQQAYPGPYNQMNPAQANYYNSMGAYNQNPYDGYQQWGQGPPQQMPPQNMQQFGMQGFGMPPQQMGYNMYGQGRN
ncbi:uncharacterized protein CG7065 [Calliphora vicina]|uniref:uncharacterized protein CG7065 n=1 Tax=Calliphora vicina TaxID=7373 RepID=UPI00325A4ACE